MKIFVMNASPKGGSVLLLHLSVMLFGFYAVLGQFVDAPAVVIAGGRVVWSSAALLVFSLVQKNDLKLKSKKDCAVALAAGVVLAVHWTTFFQAIQSSSVAIGTITFSAFPLFLTFLEPQVFHEALHRRHPVGPGLRLGLCGAVPCQPLSCGALPCPDHLSV